MINFCGNQDHDSALAGDLCTLLPSMIVPSWPDHNQGAGNDPEVSIWAWSPLDEI